ncbi:hypothetical protein CRI94_15825 [Longibacter salinarum]|uniref:Uncharacterized protein n=1 Tax=Longibacter salinarum TaxID=1850348 RepID=A0A2A8CUP0_9BACT|nr:hypothetical protein CRI94_15825 [Longibacter salinarum]
MDRVQGHIRLRNSRLDEAFGVMPIVRLIWTIVKLPDDGWKRLYSERDPSRQSMNAAGRRFARICD